MELSNYQIIKRVTCCKEFDFMRNDEFCENQPDKGTLIHFCDKLSVWQGFRSFKRYFIKNKKNGSQL